MLKGCSVWRDGEKSPGMSTGLSLWLQQQVLAKSLPYPGEIMRWRQSETPVHFAMEVFYSPCLQERPKLNVNDVMFFIYVRTLAQPLLARLQTILFVITNEGKETPIIYITHINTSDKFRNNGKRNLNDKLLSRCATLLGARETY